MCAKKKIEIAGVPMAQMPLEYYNEFTLNGQIPFFNWYMDDSRSLLTTKVFLKKDYDIIFEQIKNNTYTYYDSTLDYLNQAFDEYDLSGKEVLVFGAENINCDAIALSRGASKVYIIEYNKITSEHEKVFCMTYEEYIEKGIKCDVGISVSSFEHDGLGRYGDPIKPNGDLQAMQLAKQLLKKDGLMFLSVPVGGDAIVWNAHRIYGRLRLPLLIKNWIPIAVFGPVEDELDRIRIRPDANTPDWSNQPVIVLQNV